MTVDPGSIVVAAFTVITVVGGWIATVRKMHADRVTQTMTISEHGKRLDDLEKGQAEQNAELGEVKQTLSRVEGKVDEGFKWLRDFLAPLLRSHDNS